MKHVQKGFTNPVAIGIIAFVVVVVIMFGYYIVSKKDSAVSDVVQNETSGAEAAKQCTSDKDCGGINSYCGWNGKCIPGTSATDKTSQGGGTTPVENNSEQTSRSNLSPVDKAEFTVEDAMKTIAFRWTPIVPKPQEPVTYRLRVWQLMQGQTGSQAMKTNQPIVTKDVDNITEASVSGIYTGPCRPPYLCDYVWNVEASVKREGTATTVIGISTPFTFSVKEPPATDGGTSADTSSGTR
jgi:hypothetical protein